MDVGVGGGVGTAVATGAPGLWARTAVGIGVAANVGLGIAVGAAVGVGLTVGLSSNLIALVAVGVTVRVGVDVGVGSGPAQANPIAIRTKSRLTIEECLIVGFDFGSDSPVCPDAWPGRIKSGPE